MDLRLIFFLTLVFGCERVCPTMTGDFSRPLSSSAWLATAGSRQVAGLEGAPVGRRRLYAARGPPRVMRKEEDAAEDNKPAAAPIVQGAAPVPSFRPEGRAPLLLADAAAIPPAVVVL